MTHTQRRISLKPDAASDHRRRTRTDVDVLEFEAGRQGRHADHLDLARGDVDHLAGGGASEMVMRAVFESINTHLSASMT